MTTQNKNLTEGEVISQLLSLALPMTVGVIAIYAFNIVDTYFVGQIGAKELTAMSFTFPVVGFYSALALGLGVGHSVVISQSVGTKEAKETKSIATDGLILSVLIVCLFLFLGWSFNDWLFLKLGASHETLLLINQYMSIWYLTMPFLVIPMVGNGIIRGTGDTRFPAMIMVVAAIVNAIFDPIFIFGLGPIPEMGLSGAAWASMVSRIITFIASLWVLHFREKLIAAPHLDFQKLFRTWKKILKVGMATAGTNIMVPISMSILTAIIAQYGEDAVAAFGVVTRIEGLTMVPLIGIAASFTPFVGQNFGAKRWDRIETGLRSTMIFTHFWFIFVALVLFFTGEWLSSLFTQDENIIALCKFYFRLVPLSVIGIGVTMLITSVCNATERPSFTLKSSLLRLFVFYIPLSYLLGLYYMAKGVFMAAFFANGLVGFYSFYYYKRMKN